MLTIYHAIPDTWARVLRTVYWMLFTALAAPGFADNPGAQATIRATDCSQFAVEAAIRSAAPGDIVLVPPGECSWNGVVLDKPLHLKGSGVGKTKIVVADNLITKSPAGIIRISDFSYSKTGGQSSSSAFKIDGFWHRTQPVIVENNEFVIKNSDLFQLEVPGGVIFSNNKFYGDWDDTFIHFGGGVDKANSWRSDDTMGVKDADGKLNAYVENNTFNGGTNKGIDVDLGGRIVYRHNTLIYSSFNSHGFASSASGVRHFEIYNNKFIHKGEKIQLANQNWAIWIRGGTGVIFDNEIAELAGKHWGNKSEIKLSIRGAEDARPQGSCTRVDYPVPHQIGQGHDGRKYFTDPIYIWGNTKVGGYDGKWDWKNPFNVQGKTDQIEYYADWNWKNPCSFGWNHFFKWGRDAIKDGTPKPGYTPYVYPHPLATISKNDSATSQCAASKIRVGSTNDGRPNTSCDTGSGARNSKAPNEKKSAGPSAK